MDRARRSSRPRTSTPTSIARAIRIRVRRSSISSASGPWYWQVLPDGLIYRSYLAGVHEPRLAVVMISESGDIRFGMPRSVGAFGLAAIRQRRPVSPARLGARRRKATALPRLTLDDVRDLETVDFRGGVFADLRRRQLAIQVRLRPFELAPGRRVCDRPSRQFGRPDQLRPRFAGARVHRTIRSPRCGCIPRPATR